jgi:hypothetical protein
MRMAMADAYNGMTSVKVEILLSVFVPDLASLAFNYIYVE